MEAQDYKKLVKALRCCSKDKCGQCEYEWNQNREFCMNSMCADAAAAIEDLQAMLTEADKKQAYQHDYVCELVAEKEELQAEVERLEPKRGEIVRCGECKYSSKPDTNGEIWCKREGHGEDLMECHGVGWFCADGEKEVQE